MHWEYTPTVASLRDKAQNANTATATIKNMPHSESEQLATRHSIVFNTLVAFVVIIGFSLISMLASL